MRSWQMLTAGFGLNLATLAVITLLIIMITIIIAIVININYITKSIIK